VLRIVMSRSEDPPDDASAFGQEVAVILRAILADDFVGAYFVGSIALGGYVRGQSDIDIVGVCCRRITKETKQLLAEQLLEATINCPARGLEFTLYRAEVASSARGHAAFEVNVNGGPRMARSVHLSAPHEPGFWYVLDRAIAHRQGIAISGPPGAEVFADFPRRVLVDAMGQSMRWHREREKATLYSVLDACRAWRFAVENVLGSKLEAASWARERLPLARSGE